MRLAIVAALSACGSGGSHMDSPDASPGGSGVMPDAAATAIVDHDLDGLDDAHELALANDYLPYVSLAEDDGCPLDGMVARVSPHPADATKIVIIYSHLFQDDCGLGGHGGDDESFGILIDPLLPAPGGILAIKTASHQNTPCERDSECSTCAGDSRPACDLAAINGASFPVLYASKDKHGQYATLDQCPFLGTCFDECSLASSATHPPIVNVGEPGAPLVHDLTTEGFITPANGWTRSELMHFDPWDTTHDFGGAGNVAGDLTDTAFLPALCN